MHRHKGDEKSRGYVMLKFSTKLFVFALGCSLLLTDASARVIGGDDRGGQIGEYVYSYERIRDRGEPVVVQGTCLSACTLVLGIVPASRMCVENSAMFGFHAAWLPDETGRPQTSALGTQALLKIYPSDIRELIRKRGGLKKKMFFVRGDELPSRYSRNCGR